MLTVPSFGKKQRRAFICCLDSNDNETKTKERRHQWFLLLFVGDQIFLSQKRRSTEAEGGAWSLGRPIFPKTGQSITKRQRKPAKASHLMDRCDDQWNQQKKQREGEQTHRRFLPLAKNRARGIFCPFDSNDNEKNKGEVMPTVPLFVSWSNLLGAPGRSGRQLPSAFQSVTTNEKKDRENQQTKIIQSIDVTISQPTTTTKCEKGVAAKLTVSSFGKESVSQNQEKDRRSRGAFVCRFNLNDNNKKQRIGDANGFFFCLLLESSCRKKEGAQKQRGHLDAPDTNRSVGVTICHKKAKKGR